MTATQFSPVYDSFLDYLVEKATPAEILAFQLPEQAQQRASDLLARSSAGTLTPDEAAELEQMRRLDQLVSLLKAKALEALSAT